MSEDSNYRRAYDFERVVSERNDEMDALVEQIEHDLSHGRNCVTQRMKNPAYTTVAPAVREAALKRSIIKKLSKGSDLAAHLAALIVSLHLDEIELSLVMDTRRNAALDYWKRLADGKVYAGARAFFDMLANNHRITAGQLASLNEAETEEINKTIQRVLERKWSR